jgi:phage shock protein PspC (stress-responsive transcriptional regulator)
MVRILWVLLALVAGSSILAYFIAWFIIPRRQIATIKAW